MIDGEPKIKVGICTGREVRLSLNGRFRLEDRRLSGPLNVLAEEGEVRVVDGKGMELLRGKEILCRAEAGATFTIYDVTIGVNFHWERKREETFRGDLKFIAHDADNVAVINEIGLEDYLVSVISSEMSPTAPGEFLKAHAVVSRSWLAAMLEHKGKQSLPVKRTKAADGEMIRWYDREDHGLFDVCADDHCQRYQGIPGKDGERAAEAVLSTRGVFLTHDGEICDARYHKACGGLTDNFATAWEDKDVPYLTSISDSALKVPAVTTERESKNWIGSLPDAYCNVDGGAQILREILPDFDRETVDFFRWRVEYSRLELEEILREKAGIVFGILMDLIPLARGPSGRISRLQILGSHASVVVGKELEIRRLLSRSHLLSSAFVVSIERDSCGAPVSFILHGAGWGHGVGLCQVGAAVMAAKGFDAAAILSHYFRGTFLKKLY